MVNGVEQDNNAAGWTLYDTGTGLAHAIMITGVDANGVWGIGNHLEKAMYDTVINGGSPPQGEVWNVSKTATPTFLSLTVTRTSSRADLLTLTLCTSGTWTQP